MKNYILPVALLIAALALLPHKSAFALPYSVTAIGVVQVNSTSTNAQTLDFANVKVEQPATSGSKSLSVIDTIAALSASVNAAATLGSASITMSTSVTSPLGLLEPNAEASGVAGWMDEVNVSSSTLAFGTPVDLQLTQFLTATMTSAGHAGNFISFDIELYEGHILGGFPSGPILGLLAMDLNNGEFSLVSSNLGATVCSGFCSTSQSQTFQSVIGQTITIRGEMKLSSSAFNCITDIQAITTCENSSFASIDAGHTGRMFLDSLTEGVSLTTASGASYSTPVPEPSTILLLGAGLVGLVVWRRKHAA